MYRQFLNEDVHSLVAKLTLDEKISLLGAPNWWNTTPVERLEIPAIRMSDGPNVSFPNALLLPIMLTGLQGARGSSHFASTPAICIPVSDYFSSP
jgi:beta-glucosidase